MKLMNTEFTACPKRAGVASLKRPPCTKMTKIKGEPSAIRKMHNIRPTRGMKKDLADEAHEAITFHDKLC